MSYSDKVIEALTGKPVSDQLSSDPHKQAELRSAVNCLQFHCHKVATEAGWWNHPETGEALDRNDGELLMLMVSELAEAMEGLRKNLQDDHLPEYKMVTVELADTIIRICDYAGAHGLPLGPALVDKLVYNIDRADHKPENRVKENGKKF